MWPQVSFATRNAAHSFSYICVLLLLLLLKDSDIAGHWPTESLDQRKHGKLRAYNQSPTWNNNNCEAHLQ